MNSKLILILCLLAIGCGTSISKKQNQSPNIIFIMSDDHTSQAWGIYGGVLEKYAINQNIKRLAAEGVVLDNAFCTNSICVPSRASILTGQYSHINQVYTLSDAFILINSMLPNLFKNRLPDCSYWKVALKR